MTKYKLHDVFLSYRRFEDEARTDAQGTEIAEAIYHYLQSKGIKVFWDRPEMETGSFEEQLRWQLEHSPVYIFIATENARRFRRITKPGERDYVAEEVRYALAKYEEEKAKPNRSRDRVIFSVIPQKSRKQKELQENGAPVDTAPYPEEIHNLLTQYKLQNVELSGGLPSTEELKLIHKYATVVNRGSLWNAGSRWLEEMTKPGSRFANLNIDQTIMPLAGAEPKESVLLPIRAHLEEKQDAPLMDMIRDTKGHLYLIGEGGIGKTTALFSIMKKVYGPEKDENDIDRYRFDRQVPLFVELSKAPDTYGRLYEGGRSTFIQREVYRQIRQDLKVKQVSSAAVQEINDAFNLDPDTAVKPIRDLFTQESPAPEYLLLLDGLNEVSRTEIKYMVKEGDGTEKTGKMAVASMVLQEIKQLMEECPNVRVILTSRSKEQTNWSEKTTMLYLSGVQDEAIESYLKRRSVSDMRIAAALQNEKLKDVLRIPLFLTLYAALKGNDEILTRGEILHLFFHQKKEKLYTAKARNEAVDIDVDHAASAKQPDRPTADMLSFILDFILPEIAWRMEQDGEFYIRMRGKGSQEGLRKIIWRVLTDQSETAVCGENGIDTFGEYRRGSARNSTKKTAEALRSRLGSGDGEAQEEIANGILECAVMALGILQRNVNSEGREEYGFIHHHIRDYFAAVHQINNLRLAVFLQENEDGDTARQCLEDWKAHPLHTEVRRFIGEALGEAYNAPVCDEKGDWHYVVPQVSCDRNLIKRGFDIYRNRFDGHDGYAVWNLLEILKNVRDDLSGEDFSFLDLTKCEVNGHALGERQCVALLQGAKLSENFVMPRGHTSEIESASFSPNGRRIVTASDDGTAKVWDAETMQEIGTLKGHSDYVLSASYSPDGQRIVTASEDGTAKVWDAETMREIGTLKGHSGWITSASYNLDRRRIVTTSEDGTAKIWDADTMREIGTLKGHSDYVCSAGYSPDGQWIVTASRDGTAKVWDADTMREIGTLKGHSWWVTSASYSPDGRRIVTASLDKTAKVWGADTLREIATLKVDSYMVKSAVYSPDGRRIVTTSVDGTGKVWDAETMQEIGTLKGHPGSVFSASYSPDGQRIVTASGGTVKVWDADTMREIGTLKVKSDFVRSAGYSPDGRWIITASRDGTAKVWDVDTMREIGALKGHSNGVESASYSPDGQRIVTASWDGTTRVWDAETLREIGTLKGRFWWVYSPSYSPDGRWIVTAFGTKKAKVWNADTMQEIGTLKGHSADVLSASYSSDGRRIVTASVDGTAKVWDAKTMREIDTLKGHSGRVTSAVYSPDRRWIVTASEDGTAKAWDTKTMREIDTMEGHSEWVNSASYSPDGRRIVTASRDKTVKVWDAETMQEIGTLKGHSEWVESASYSPDGRWIVTASTDGTAKVWDAETFECLHTIHNIPGLEVIGVDFRHLHPNTCLSDEVKERLYEYGAIVDERG